MFITILLLIIGLVILILGAESMVRGASSISQKAGIPPIVIGLTIVAFGTSAPELIVNMYSALRGTTDLAIGNIIGSNISNIFLILGISALITNLKIQKNTTWKEIPFATLSILVIIIMANDIFLDGHAANFLTRTDGLALLGFFAIFLAYTYELSRKDATIIEGDTIEVYSYPISALLTVLGIIMLFFGGTLLVDNATELARMAGMSEMFIGLTVVAIGTSLPELATSVIAAMKKQNDIAVGNVVGSNIFNTFWILGATSSITPIPINPLVNTDLMVNLVASVLLFSFIFIGKKHQLEKWQGVLFLLAYFSYTGYLIARG